MNTSTSLNSKASCRQPVDWQQIETVLLDMDGTLLDKYFDDYFWEEYVPAVYSRKHGTNMNEARELLLATYRRVEDTLVWTDLDYWSTQLKLDISCLKHEVRHLIDLRPMALEFLQFLDNAGKKPIMVTNAHPVTLAIKMEKVPIKNSFRKCICSQEVGYAKEEPVFWSTLQALVQYDPETTLLVDDTEKVLHSAKTFGIGHLLHIAEPSSRKAPQFSAHFPSIASYREIIS